MNPIDISVIIPVKNGQRYLESVLKGVFSQEINAEFEVIIVDSGSTDKTLDIIAQYPVRLYQIEENEFNHGLTRNLGISKAQGKYIILMTADAIPCDNYWMKRLIENIKEDQGVAGVYSKQVPHKESALLTQIRVNRFFTSSMEKRISQIKEIKDYEKLPPKEKHRLCNFDTISACIRKDVWEKFPFPKTNFAEDLEWTKKVLEAGYKIVYEPHSVIYHSHDFSPLEWYRKNRMNSGKLFTLFGIDTVNNPLRLFVAAVFYIFRDTYLIYKIKRNPKDILANMHLVILYSFFGTLGQYRGIKDSFS